MKKLPKNTSRIFFILVLVAALGGCRKTETTETVTADDAADAVSSSLTTASGGISESATDVAQFTYSQGYGKNGSVQTLTCGVPFDTTITRTHTGTVTASYTYHGQYLLSCNAMVPESVAYTGSHTGNYDGLKMQSSNSGNSSLTVTGLQPSAQQYTVSGSYSRSGSCTSKVRNHNTFTSEINITLTNVAISKSTMKITGGNGTATVQCSTTGGRNYNFTGDIVFNGDNTATLTVNGNSYTIQLY